MSFKKRYNEYVKQQNAENENLLLREICYNTNFFVGYIEVNKNKNIKAEKNTENELLLNVYTDISEFSEKEKNKYSGIVEYNFKEIVELINKMLANGICINSNAEKFKIKNNGLMELKRQMNFSGSNEEFRLSQNDDFIKPDRKSVV